MELLCDRNVADKYYQAFRGTDWLSVRRVSDVLSKDAPDSAIIDHAREREVVFTSDVRFLADDEAETEPAEAETPRADCGVIFYRQLEDPSPGDIVDAIRAIARAYQDYNEIREYVPGKWI